MAGVEEKPAPRRSGLNFLGRAGSGDVKVGPDQPMVVLGHADDEQFRLADRQSLRLEALSDQVDDGFGHFRAEPVVVPVALSQLLGNFDRHDSAEDLARPDLLLLLGQATDRPPDYQWAGQSRFVVLVGEWLYRVPSHGHRLIRPVNIIVGRSHNGATWC